ncbi:reverse transcriptase domain-containing protein [Yersinia enterocolitica]|uniref:reverse transcriptase domain-containing protein n=1 Tax=Yersinia enterocolitica TaxID=630 RepID=UPI003AB28BD4
MTNPISAWLDAYQWLYHCRRNAPANADVWHLRFHWAAQGMRLLEQVCSGQYKLSPMLVIRQGQDSWAQWCARDALVLKWVALQIVKDLPIHQRCAHVKGHGGVRRSIADVAACLQHEEWRFVYRTDIRGYYRHIRKQQVLSQINWRVQSPILRDLLKQYLYYSVEDGGEIHTPITGISRGCALSPMIGASLLHHVDSYFASREEIFYVRYMDDFLLFTRTRWSLRRMVKQLATFFDLGGFSIHPDKTQVGKIEHGFDWLGLWFGTKGPSIAPRALENHRARRVRLYEQARRKRLSATETDVLVQAYEARWNTWAEGMLAAGRYKRG